MCGAVKFFRQTTLKITTTTSATTAIPATNLKPKSHVKFDKLFKLFVFRLICLLLLALVLMFIVLFLYETAKTANQKTDGRTRPATIITTITDQSKIAVGSDTITKPNNVAKVMAGERTMPATTLTLATPSISLTATKINKPLIIRTTTITTTAATITTIETKPKSKALAFSSASLLRLQGSLSQLEIQKQEQHQSISLQRKQIRPQLYELQRLQQSLHHQKQKQQLRNKRNLDLGTSLSEEVPAIATRIKSHAITYPGNDVSVTVTSLPKSDRRAALGNISNNNNNKNNDTELPVQDDYQRNLFTSLTSTSSSASSSSFLSPSLSSSLLSHDTSLKPSLSTFSSSLPLQSSLPPLLPSLSSSLSLPSPSSLLALDMTWPSSSTSPFSKKMPTPFFDFGMPRNITARSGQMAVINCRVENLGDKSVSWIRKRDLHILTVGVLTYTSDERFRVVRTDDSKNWPLYIKFAQTRDSGTYECQVNTEPKISMSFRLKVIVILPDSKATIAGPTDLYAKVGSAITLNCHVKQPTSKDIGPIYWYRGPHIITPFLVHPNDAEIDLLSRISMETQLGDILKSSLRINDAHIADSGNYSCVPTTAEAASIMLHVIDDEHPAAMQKSSASPIASGCRWLHRFSCGHRHWQQKNSFMTTTTTTTVTYYLLHIIIIINSWQLVQLLLCNLLKRLNES